MRCKKCERAASGTACLFCLDEKNWIRIGLFRNYGIVLPIGLVWIKAEAKITDGWMYVMWEAKLGLSQAWLSLSWAMFTKNPESVGVSRHMIWEHFKFLKKYGH